MFRWDEEKEKLLQFLIEQSQNADAPLSMRSLIREIRWRFDVLHTDNAIIDRIRRIGYDIPNLDLDMDTKVKLKFALSITLDIDFFEEVKEHAEVLRVDDFRRIIEYKSKNLELKGEHTSTSDVGRKLSSCHDFLRYFAENVKNYTRPVQQSVLLDHYKHANPSSKYSAKTLGIRFYTAKKEIYTLTEFDKETRVRMMFVSGASVPQYAIKELEKEANFSLDDRSRIISYEAIDGSLSLNLNGPRGQRFHPGCLKTEPVEESIVEEEESFESTWNSSWILDHTYAKSPADEMDFMDLISDAVEEDATMEEESGAENPKNPQEMVQNSDLSPKMALKTPKFEILGSKNAPKLEVFAPKCESWNPNDRYPNRRPPKFHDFDSTIQQNDEEMADFSVRIAPKPIKNGSNRPFFHGKSGSDAMFFPPVLQKMPDFSMEITPKSARNPPNSMDFEHKTAPDDVQKSIFHEKPMDFELEMAHNSQKSAPKFEYFEDFEVETTEKSSYPVGVRPNSLSIGSEMIQNTLNPLEYPPPEDYGGPEDSMDFGDESIDFHAGIDQNSMDFESSGESIFNDFGSKNSENMSEMAPESAKNVILSPEMAPISMNFEPENPEDPSKIAPELLQNVILSPETAPISMELAPKLTENASKSSNLEDSVSKIREKSSNSDRNSSVFMNFDSGSIDFQNEMNQNSMDFESSEALITDFELENPSKMIKTAPESPNLKDLAPKMAENDAPGPIFNQKSSSEKTISMDFESKIAPKSAQNDPKSSISMDFELENPSKLPQSECFPPKFAPELLQNVILSPEKAPLTEKSEPNSMDLAPKLAPNAPKSLNLNDLDGKMAPNDALNQVFHRNRENFMDFLPKIGHFSEEMALKIKENEPKTSSENPGILEEVSRESPAPSVIIEEDSDDSDIEILETEDNIQVVETENSGDSVDLERPASPPYLEVLRSIRTMVIVLDFFDFSEIQEKKKKWRSSSFWIRKRRHMPFY